MNRTPPKKSTLRSKSPQNGDARAEIHRLHEQIAELIARDPAKAAKILTLWIHSGAQSTQLLATKKKAG